MTIEKIVEKRNIKEVLHYTTSVGLLGILDRGAVESRFRVPRETRLEFILRLNTPIVKDPAWVDYVNLSITRINIWLYTFSRDKWHPDVWWAVLSFDPAILTHKGVYFVTTNNIYPSAKRGQGPGALEALFAPVVGGRYGRELRRTTKMPASFTTCEQAEVLYPKELSTKHLRRIYVATGDDQDDVCGQFEAVRHAPLEVVVEPKVFGSPVGNV